LIHIKAKHLSLSDTFDARAERWFPVGPSVKINFSKEAEMVEKIGKDKALSALQKAKAEIERLEKDIDAAVGTRDVTDCTCNNPGCSGAEVVTYAVAVGASFAGGASG
jgi:hypothetical protein